MKKKRIRSLVLTTTLCASLFAGCGKYTGVNSTLPTYSKDDVIIRTAWWCPEPTEENYKTYAECNLNNVMLANGDFYTRYDNWGELDEKTIDKIVKTDAYYVGKPKDFTDENATEKALRLAKENNMTVYLSEGNGYFTENVYDDFEFDYDEYKDTIVGVFAGDEPSAPAISEYAQYIPGFESRFSNIPYFCNLFPIYADSTTVLKTDSYSTYLDTYCTEFMNKLSGPKLLSVDYYPFQGNNYTMWLYNYELIAKKAIENNADLHTFILSCLGDESWQYHDSGENGIRLQVNTALAYGSTSYAYFLYKPAKGGFDIGLLNEDMKPSDMYYKAQTANKEVQSLENAFKHYDYVCTSPMSNDENDFAIGSFAAVATHSEDIYNESKLLTEVSTDNRILVTLLRDKDGNEAYYIVNFYDREDTEETEDANVSLKLNNMNKASLYGTKECLTNKTVDLSQNTFNYTLAPGEGVLVVPYNK